METLKCSKCQIVKPINEFHANKASYRGYSYNCKQCIKEYRSKNPHLETKWRHKWKENGGIVKYRKYQNNYKLKPLTKITTSLRARLATMIRLGGYKKTSKLNEIIGCNWEQLKQHIEKQFDNKMNWGNYGEYWEIDHIIPLSKAKNKQEIYELNHYSNLQPLYWKNNREKSDKII